jgi:hypothetical protein
VTLPAGTYNFRASISSFEETSYGGTAEFRLRNTTDGSTIGSSVLLPTIGTNLAGGAVLHGDFTLAGSKVVRLEINYASGSHTWTARYPVLEIVKVGASQVRVNQDAHKSSCQSRFVICALPR